LDNEQFGFRPRASPDQAAYIMISSILTALNDKLVVGGIFCDLQKAFDCVNHEILIDKLEYYGIQGKFSSLIKSYLTGRFQRVIIGNSSHCSKSSNWKQIKNGVPQGSILGPLLFLMYINDLPRVLDVNTNKVRYADDTSILITGSNKIDFEKSINQTLQKINMWFQSNRLTLNVNKTQFLEFRLKHLFKDNIKTDYKQNYMNNAIEVSFLGLFLDGVLSWKKHIDQLTSKLCSACYVLRNIREVLSRVILKTVYFTHIHTLLSYGIIFWGSSSYAKKIFMIQKKSIRITTNSKPTDSCRHHFINLEIMMMYAQYIYSLMVHTVKNLHLYEFNNEIHEYRTRYNNTLHLPNANLKRYKDGPHFSAIKIYNHFPEYIQDLKGDLKRFKKTLKGYLCWHSYYSIQEYYDGKDDF